MVEFVSTNMCVGGICRKHGIPPSTSGNRRRMFMDAGKKEIVGTGGKGRQRVPKGDLVQRVAALGGRACKSGNKPVAFLHGRRTRRGWSRCPQGSGPHAGRLRPPAPCRVGQAARSAAVGQKHAGPQCGPPDRQAGGELLLPRRHAAGRRPAPERAHESPGAKRPVARAPGGRAAPSTAPPPPCGSARRMSSGPLPACPRRAVAIVADMIF